MESASAHSMTAFRMATYSCPVSETKSACFRSQAKARRRATSSHDEFSNRVSAEGSVRSKGRMEDIVRSCEPRWPQTNIVWRQVVHMDLVMKRLDVDITTAARRSGGAAIADARDACRACLSHRRCRDWLEQRAEPSDLAQFCPNAAFFEECGRAE